MLKQEIRSNAHNENNDMLLYLEDVQLFHFICAQDQSTTTIVDTFTVGSIAAFKSEQKQLKNWATKELLVLITIQIFNMSQLVKV